MRNNPQIHFHTGECYKNIVLELETDRPRPSLRQSAFKSNSSVFFFFFFFFGYLAVTSYLQMFR